MNKELFLKEKFIEKYGNKLGSKSRLLNVLSNLTMGDNITIIEDSIKFYDDRVELSIQKENEDEEVLDGKIVIYDSNRYYYLEENKLVDTSLGFVYDNRRCALKYKSVYDDFTVEHDMGFDLYKNEDGILCIRNNLFDVPLSTCFQLLKNQIETNMSVSRNVGLLISDDMYKIFEFKMNVEQKNALRRSLSQRIHDRFEDAYDSEDIDNDMKVKNEMSMVYDLVNHPNISLTSINFQGKEGFDKYNGQDLANAIEVNIERTDGAKIIPGKFIIYGKYVIYTDTMVTNDIYSDRIDIRPSKKGYLFEYKCRANSTGYIYNIHLDHEEQMSGRGLAKEYISLSTTNLSDESKDRKTIISSDKYDSYYTDDSVYYLVGELVSYKYRTMIEDYINKNCKKKLK